MKTTLIKSYTLQLASCMLACPILTWGNHPGRYCEGKLGAQSFMNSNNKNTFFTSYQKYKRFWIDAQNLCLCVDPMARVKNVSMLARE